MEKLPITDVVIEECGNGSCVLKLICETHDKAIPISNNLHKHQVKFNVESSKNLTVKIGIGGFNGVSFNIEPGEKSLEYIGLINSEVVKWICVTYPGIAYSDGYLRIAVLHSTLFQIRQV